MKKLLQILACLALPFGVQAQTIDLYPDYDAALGYHDGYNTSSQNYGTATQNSAYCIPGAIGGLNMNRALIHFDLSQFTPGTTIVSATLDLYALGPNGILQGHTGANNGAFVKAVTSAWQEMSVTWDTQPTYSNTNPAVLAASTSITQDYTGIDVTDMVRDMVNNPQTNFGFGLMQQNEVVTNALCFASNDHPNQLIRPILHVTLCNDNFSFIADYDAALGTHDGQNTSGNNYGTAPQNAAYSVTATNGTPSGNSNRALIHFDLTSIPSNSVVTSATMKLYARGQNGNLNGHAGNANTSTISTVASPWSDATVTWDNQPAPGFVVATLAQSTGPLQDYTNIDVTAAVQDMVGNPLTNNGFMLQLLNEVETNALIFQSLECGDPTKFPALEVTIACGKVTAADAVVHIEEGMQLFPNPTAQTLSLRLDLEKPSAVMVQLIDLQGRVIGQHEAGVQSAGKQIFNLDTLVSQAAAGMFIVRAQIGEQVIDRKLVLTGN
ncbi:MAG: DNRLRE domain-containing protein [Bacteroidetes bacterium]|nr:DNRLRE domain-containing protein [Bacteroidota bacterium]